VVIVFWTKAKSNHSKPVLRISLKIISLISYD